MYFSSREGALWLNDQRFYLKGCSWFGCETNTKCVHGIWAHSVDHFLDFLITHNFNAIRLPFTAQLALELDRVSPTAVNCSCNESLEGLSAGGVLDYIIKAAAQRGLLVMLDMHCLTHEAGITELWYTKAFSEEELINAWTTITRRYLNSWNVFAADIKNEPHNSASWGDNNISTDWRLAAQRIGNAVLAVNPKLLIFVEGTSGYQVPIQTPEGAFWGGSLASAKEAPVILNIPEKLVYSPHAYGPGVYMQEYFKHPEFPKNMPDIWRRQWGHLLSEPKAGPAIVIGEWGGRFEEESLERSWAEAFVEYLCSIGATDQFFWCLNPNSGDTGGLLEDDWCSPCTYKLQLLQRLCPQPSKIEVSADGSSITSVNNYCPSRCSNDGAAQIQNTTIATLDNSQELNHGSNIVQHKEQAVDTSAVPGLQASSKITKHWITGQGITEYLVEFSVKNGGNDATKEIMVHIRPANCARQIWNLEAEEMTDNYRLVTHWAPRAGLRGQEEVSWGGIFSTSELEVVYTQCS